VENSRDKNIGEAIKKYGPITDRFILRLGKNEEEAGKFESWHANSEDFTTDLDSFLACLTLTRLVDSVEERMKTRKAGIRGIKKQQKETAKVLAREQTKLQKALEKAAAKVVKEQEKQRIKAEAKAERERAKIAKKNPAVTLLALEKDFDKTEEEACTYTYESVYSIPLDTTHQPPSDTMSLSPSPITTVPEMPQQGLTILTAVTETSSLPSFEEEKPRKEGSYWNLPME